MRWGTVGRSALAAALGLGLVGLAPAVAHAAPPANDDIAAATEIGTLPFTVVQSTAEATEAPDDPQTCFVGNSVWFRLTAPATGTLRLDLTGTNYSPDLSAFTGSPGALVPVPSGCGFGGLMFPVSAGESYYLRVAQCCSGGTLRMTVEIPAPPDNDAFAAATAVGAVPFTDSVDMVAATREAGEPASNCDSGSIGTAWYAFTPAVAGSYTVSASNGSVAAFTGASLRSLTELDCSFFGGRFPIAAGAGQTYVLRLSGSGSATISIRPAQPPQPSIFASPFDPSVFDTIDFHDFGSDPEGGQVTTREWDFGDGSTSSDPGPTHRYAADGDYQVRLTVHTADGRTGSTSQLVQVRTHDVAIVSLDAPRTGQVNRTARITVRVRNTRLPETVTVTLLHSTPNGFGTVGSSTQLVTVGARTRTTPFTFNYTFTPDDQVTGKVTFKATATLNNARDALPADNEAVAPPTTVR